MAHYQLQEFKKKLIWSGDPIAVILSIVHKCSSAHAPKVNCLK